MSPLQINQECINISKSSFSKTEKRVATKKKNPYLING